MSVKHRVRNYIVPRLGAAIPADASSLYDATTDAVNLAVGGFAMYEPVLNAGGLITSGNQTAVVAAATATNTPFFQFIQHRDKSMDTNPLYERTFEKSPVFKPGNITAFRGTAARLRNNHVTLIGAAAAAAGAVPVNNETEYIINGSLKGWHTDMYNGESRVLYMGRFTTPDYSVSTLYTVVNQQRDHILQNVAYDFNQQTTGQLLMAFCIDTTAAAPVGAGQAYTVASVAALTIGASIIIGYNDNAQPIRLTLDADLIETFRLLAAALPGGSLLVPYARPTAANLAVAGRIVAGGRVAADATAAVDHIAVLTLDLKRSAYHEVKNRKERGLVGVDGGFDVTTSVNVNAVDANEGAGFGKDLKFEFASFLGHRAYPGGKPWQPNYVAFPNEIEEDGWYDVYVIESKETPFATDGMPSVSPQVTVVAVLNRQIGTAVTNPYFTGVVNPQRTYIETRMNSMAATYGFNTVTL